MHECLRHPFDQRRWWIVRNEIQGQLPRDKPGAGGPRDDQADGVLNFTEALARDRMAEQRFRAEIMPRRIEFKGAAAKIESLHLGFELRCFTGVYAHTGEYSRKLLHIALRV